IRRFTARARESVQDSHATGELTHGVIAVSRQYPSTNDSCIVGAVRGEYCVDRRAARFQFSIPPCDVGLELVNRPILVALDAGGFDTQARVERGPGYWDGVI